MRAQDRDALLGGLLRRVLEQHPAFVANPLGDWGELVGEQVAHHSQPVALKKNVLTVVAYDSIWKHHLDLHKEALMEKINGKRKEPLVEKIVIRVGEVPASLPALNPNHGKLEKIPARRPRPKRKSKAPARALTPEERALLKTLPDADLRAIGARLLKHTPPGDE